MENLEILVKIYNTLTLVSTKGEDTIIMGQCLSAMREVLTNMQQSFAQVDLTEDNNQ